MVGFSDIYFWCMWEATVIMLYESTEGHYLLFGGREEQGNWDTVNSVSEGISEQKKLFSFHSGHS